MSGLEELSCKSRDSQYLQQKRDVRGRSVPLIPKVWLFKDKKSLCFALMKAKVGRQANCLCQVFWFCFMLDTCPHWLLVPLDQPHCSRHA